VSRGVVFSLEEFQAFQEYQEFQEIATHFKSISRDRKSFKRRFQELLKLPFDFKNSDSIFRSMWETCPRGPVLSVVSVSSVSSVSRASRVSRVSRDSNTFQEHFKR